MAKPFRQRLGEVRLRIRDFRHWVLLRRLPTSAPGYREYLEIQLRRSLSKRSNDPGVGARILVDAVASSLPESRDARVLCVGCRNAVELDAFLARKVGRVVGIDLFSQRDDILVMDMHAMTFEDESFDAVYSSHSLEHSYDPAVVAAEMLRVARNGGTVAVEVPLRTSASVADRIVFAGLADVRRLFEASVGDVLLAEEEAAYSPRNEQGSEIGRLVFRVEKPAAR
jgi:SAM-dependent methyltransferase